MKRFISALICLIFALALVPAALSDKTLTLPVFAGTTEEATLDAVTQAQLDVTDSYFYDRLSEQQQWCYNFLKNSYDNCELEPGVYQLDASDVFPISEPYEYYQKLNIDFFVAGIALRADHPLYEIHPLAGFGASSVNEENREPYFQVHISDFATEYNIARTEARIQQIVETVGDGDRYTQLYKLAHYYMSNTFYDPYLEIIQTPNYNNERFLEARASFYQSSAYGILLENYGICGGFAQSVKVLCDALNIPCIIMGNHKHEWNLVQMEDGSWYRFDMTEAVAVGWEKTPDIEGYFENEFLTNSTFTASDLYDNPYMIALNNVHYVTEFPEQAEDRYVYLGDTTDFSYTEAPSTFDPGEPRFTYRVHRDGKTCTIVNYEGKEEGNLIIPSEIDGYTVTNIAACAFYYATGFDGKLVIPSTVQNIGRGAFACCYNLKEIEFSNGLSKIEHGAFIGCKGLAEVTLPDTLTTIEDRVFVGCSNLLKINVGSHVQTIMDYAFSGNSNCTVSGPKNSITEQYALENNFTFTENGTVCNFADVDDKWEYSNEEHFHTCVHGVRIDIETHYNEDEIVTGCGYYCDACNAQYCVKYGFLENVETIKDARPATCLSPAYSGDVWCICGQFQLAWGTDVGEKLPHTPKNNEWVVEEWIHYQLCECGYQLNVGGHEGGTATATERAICDTCGSKYGDLLHIHSHSPKDDTWTGDEYIHYQLCECGFALNIGGHEGGTATATERAKCDTCGTEYGDLLHIHSHSPKDDTWTGDEYIHYQLCECGYQLNIGGHEGGTATATRRAICDTCGAEYGELATSGGSDDPHPDHVHSEENAKIEFDLEWHYIYCQCGEYLSMGGHYGGTATTTELAKCEVCGIEYGELAHGHAPIDDKWFCDEWTHYQICECGEWLSHGSHTGGEATTTERAKCEVCGTEYGELLHEHAPYFSNWFSDETVHYQVCQCGEQINSQAHTGGTATVTELARCEVCGVFYGSLLEPETTNVPDSPNSPDSPDSPDTPNVTDAPAVTPPEELETFLPLSKEEQLEQLKATDTYYYDRINERQKWCYLYIKDYYDNYTGALVRQRINLSDMMLDGWTEEDAREFLRDFIIGELALRADHPEYKMMGEISEYAANYDESGKIDAFITISHPDLRTEDNEAQIAAKIQQIIDTVGDGDRYTKLYRLTHYILTNTFYDPYVFVINESGHRDHALATRGHMYNQSIYGLFLENIAVCDGFSQSVKLLCNRLEIPCIIVGNKGHAWNMVQMEDGRWYRLDITNAAGIGWDASTDIDYYFDEVFLNNNVFGAETMYSDPYMISFDFVAHVTEFPELAEHRYVYRGTTTDFSYTVAESTYKAGDPKFIYKVNADGKTCTIISYEGKQEGNLIIPGEIDGYTVTSIAPYAFYYCTGFDGMLIIPDTVTEIGQAAFAGCYNLTSVRLSNNLRFIFKGAFIGCKGLTSITLPDSLNRIDDYAFLSCDGLVTATFGRHVQIIGQRAIGFIDDMTAKEGFSILAPENSEAHRYALQNSLGFTASGVSCDFLDVNGALNFEGEYHFRVCSHGVRFDFEAHSHEQGYLNCGDRCEACGAQKCNKYGFFESVEKTVGAHEATCSSPAFTGDVVCMCENVFFRSGEYVGEPTGVHAPADDTWYFDNYCHYQLCDCAEVLNSTAHSGGVATQTERAICEICGAHYGTTLDPDDTNTPETNDPETNAPETNDPETNTPEINTPETNAPETNDPETNDPEINAPETNAPETKPNGTTENGNQSSSGGCSGVIGTSSAVIAIISLMSLAFFKKKED